MLRHSLFATVCAVVLCAAASGAHAEEYAVRSPHERAHENEPLGTLKPGHILQPEEPVQDAVSPAPPPPTDEVQIHSSSGIDVGELPAENLQERMGTLTGPVSAGDAIWQYMDRAQAETLIHSLPTPLRGGGIHDMVVRLLLSEAAPPHGEAKGWLNERIEALLRIGATEDAATLAALVPNPSADNKTLQNTILVALLSGRRGQACDALLTEDASAIAALPEMLQRVHLFCLADAGQIEQAELALSLKQESRHPAPEWFASLIDAMQYPDSRLSALPEAPEPLDMAMIVSAAPARLPEGRRTEELLEPAYQPYHAVLAASEELQPQVRAQFAESVIDTGGSISREEMESLYRAAAVNPNAPKALRQRINAYLQLVDAPNTKTALRDFNDALKAFRDHPILSDMMLSPVLSIMSKTMRPEQPYLSYAPQAIAILLSAGKLEDAGRWLRMMDVHRESSTITYVAHELARFVALHGKRPSHTATQLPPFAIPSQADRDDLRLLQRYFRIMPLFGYQVPDVTAGILEEKFAAMEKNRADWPLDVMKQESEKGNMAAVVLTSADFTNRTHWLEVGDEGLYILLESLLASGQKDMAHRIAIESLLAFMR